MVNTKWCKFEVKDSGTQQFLIDYMFILFDSETPKFDETSKYTVQWIARIKCFEQFLYSYFLLSRENSELSPTPSTCMLWSIDCIFSEGETNIKEAETGVAGAIFGRITSSCLFPSSSRVPSGLCSGNGLFEAFWKAIGIIKTCNLIDYSQMYPFRRMDKPAIAISDTLLGLNGMSERCTQINLILWVIFTTFIHRTSYCTT